MNYDEAVQYLLDIPKFSKKPSLFHTEELLEKLEVLNEDRKIIHVAGTNGKGSVCTYLNEILLKNNKTTGLFTSPHLITPNERIRINGEIISDDEFLESFNTVLKCADENFDKDTSYPTFFEFLFAMAMYIFKKKDVEYIILETGMGGRLDQTNVVKNPIVTIITEIGYDHMEYLGDTLAKIASEKAGIIKKGVPVVYMGNKKECNKVIEDTAIINGCQFYKLTKSMIRLQKKTNKAIDFSLHYSYYESSALTVDSVAPYQMENSALAYMAALLIPEKLVFDGHFTSKWEGRMEEVAPNIYVDGGHNEDGIDAFLEAAATLEGERHLLFSAVSDKAHNNMIKKICDSGIFTKYIVTKLDNYRAVSEEKLYEEFKEYTDEVYKFPDVSSALDFGKKNKGSATLFCAGSLYLVGSVKQYIRNYLN